MLPFNELRHALLADASLKEDKMNSLSTYAKEQRAARNVKCWTCNLPADLRAQVEAARRETEPGTFFEGGEEKRVVISYSIISNWLRDKHGIKIGSAALLAHFYHRHVTGGNDE